jgi:EAL domain-containing protein (putative c-di-GMP-specific phosphodiesterase class I)
VAVSESRCFRKTARGVRANAVGKSLKMRLAAEGVETKDQVLVLREMACAEAQG